MTPNNIFQLAQAAAQPFSEQFSPPPAFYFTTAPFFPPVSSQPVSLHHTVAFLHVPHHKEDRASGLGTYPVTG